MSEPVFQSYAEMMRATDYAAFEQQHRSGGSLGVNLFRAEQGPMEMVDPPNAEIALTSILSAEGPMEYDFNDGWSRAPMEAGWFGMQPAGVECRFRTAHPHTILVGGLNAGRLAAVLDEAGVRTDPFGPLYAAVAEPLPRVVKLMRRVWDATEREGPSANLLVDGLMREVLGELLGVAAPRQKIEPVPRLEDARLARVVKYVEAHLAEPMTVRELAAVASISVFHFTRAFGDATGRTPHRYVVARRVERARALLAGPLSLAEIAYATGLASQSHFGQVFREHVGATPGTYRAELRG